MAIDIYVRVSAVGGREGESFQSPGDQEQRCRAQLEADGLEAGRVFTDLDQSGGKMNRPAFDALMERVESGKSSGVVVARLDRLGRTTRGVLDAVARIEDAGGKFLAVREKLDTSTSTGRFVLTMFAALAELELDRYREQFDSATATYLARGGHGGTAIPPGYDRLNSGKLIPNSDAPAIQEAFRMRGRGTSLEEIAAYLKEQGVLLNRPVKPNGTHKRDFQPHTDWTGTRVGQMLRSEVYLGVASVRGQTKQAHDALVTRAEWKKVQTKSGRRAPRSGDGALLSGLVFCETCGQPMTSDGVRYRCLQRGRHAEKCERPAIMARKLIEPLIEDVVISELAERGKWYKVKLAQKKGKSAGELAAAVTQAEEEIAAYLLHVPATTLGFADGLAAREAAVAQAQAARDEAEEDDAPEIERLLTAPRIRAALGAMTPAQRRSAVAREVEKVVIRPGSGQPHTRFQLHLRAAR